MGEAGPLPIPVRVATDECATAAKTTLAGVLAVPLRSRRRDVIRASIEGFLRPRIERYRQWTESSQGCYENSFDLFDGCFCCGPSWSMRGISAS